MLKSDESSEVNVVQMSRSKGQPDHQCCSTRQTETYKKTLNEAFQTGLIGSRISKTIFSFTLEKCALTKMGLVFRGLLTFS